MTPKPGEPTLLTKILGATGAVVVLVGAGAIGQFEYQKVVAKPFVKYVEVVVTPTVLPTASPSATLAPKSFIKSIGGQGVTAPVVKPVK